MSCNSVKHVKKELEYSNDSVLELLIFDVPSTQKKVKELSIMLLLVDSC